MHKFEVQTKEGCIGKTVRKDYGIEAYQEIAPQTDATIGYRFMSLAYLSLSTVLQSHFNPKFLAQQRALEIKAFMLNNHHTSAAENQYKIFSTTEESKATSPFPIPSKNSYIQLFSVEKEASSTVKKQVIIELNEESEAGDFKNVKTKTLAQELKSDSNDEENEPDEDTLASNSPCFK